MKYENYKKLSENRVKMLEKGSSDFYLDAQINQPKTPISLQPRNDNFFRIDLVKIYLDIELDEYHLKDSFFWNVFGMFLNLLKESNEIEFEFSNYILTHLNIQDTYDSSVAIRRAIDFQSENHINTNTNFEQDPVLEQLYFKLNVLFD